MRCFHGTEARLNCFTLESAARPGMNGNGFLGVWLALTAELAGRFGPNVLDVDAPDEKPYRMPVSELAAMNTYCSQATRDMTEAEAREFERTYYTMVRENLLGQGYDLILVIEGHGKADMAIGLVPERLHIN